jgi:hypothetical protein
MPVDTEYVRLAKDVNEISCADINNITAELNEMNLNDKDQNLIDRLRYRFDKYNKAIFNEDIHKCEENEFKNALKNRRSGLNTFIIIDDFITAYRIDRIATTPNMTDERIKNLIIKLNQEIIDWIASNDPFNGKNIILKKLKETLDFKYDTNDNRLTPYKEALEANSKKIENYLSKKGGKHRKKSRSRTRSKKSKSKSKRTKSKSKK